MKIAKDAVVSFHYALTTDTGEEVDDNKGGDPLTYLHGSGHIVPGLARAMEGREAGDSFEVAVPAADGYGEHTEEAFFEIKRANLPQDVEPKVGMQLSSRLPNGNMLRFRLIEIGEDTVTADGNHPLAGQNLNFAIDVVEVRAATEDELAHGHAHGAGCSHH